MITLNKEDAFTIVDIISKAQEVIRCKDCKYGSRDPFDMRPIWCIYFDHYRNETDFCSRGVKKDE